jgi:hypothetical protein
VKELTIVVGGEKVLEENSNTFSDLVVTECQHSVDVNFAGRAYDFRWKMASWWVRIHLLLHLGSYSLRTD